MAILYTGLTDIGRKRKTNQDSICMLPEFKFFAVADGMRGHNGGDIASQMTTDLFQKYFKSYFQKLEPPELLGKSVNFINTSIYKHGQENQNLKGMGTTVTGIMFNGKYLNLVNVGDSRAYMIHKGKLFQMTRDHSLVQEKLNLGVYDREGAQKDPQKNVLIKTVGFEESVDADVYKYKVHKDDIFLLCSDGLHGKVADSDILNIINTNIPDPSNATQNQLDMAAKHLVNEANVNGGQDNISVILVLAN